MRSSTFTSKFKTILRKNRANFGMTKSQCWVSILSGLMVVPLTVFAAVLLLGLIFVEGNLRVEPIELLSGREE